MLRESLMSGAKESVSSKDRARQRLGTMVLAMASFGIAAELAPARAEAQTIAQETRVAQPARPLETRSTINHVSVDEFDRVRVRTMEGLNDVTVLPDNAFTRTHQPIYAGEISAHLQTSVAHPETNTASRRHNTITVVGGEPVRALEQATLYFGYGQRTIAYTEAAMNPALETQPAVRPATAGSGDRHEILAAYRIKSVTSDPDMVMAPVLRGGENRFSQSALSRSREEAIFQAATALVTQYAPSSENQITTASGDQRRGTLNLLQVTGRSELVLSNIHVDVQTMSDGQYRATVQANLYIPSVLEQTR